MLSPVVAVSAPPAVVLAEAAASGGFDPYSLIGTIITPVIVVALLLFGKLHTENDYQRLLSDLEGEKAERLRLQTALTDKVIPALTRSTLALETVSPLLQAEVLLRAARDRSGGG